MVTQSVIQAMITERTCGEACWEAREDICRCSCGGRNHGIYRNTGQRPERTRKLNGYRYQLVAVAVPGSCLAAENQPLDDQERAIMHKAIDAGRWEFHNFSGTPGYPAKVKTASDSEVLRWPELAAFRDRIPWNPATLWVRCDYLDLVE